MTTEEGSTKLDKKNFSVNCLFSFSDIDYRQPYSPFYSILAM